MARRTQAPVEVIHVPLPTAKRHLEAHLEHEACEEAAKEEAAREEAAKEETAREEAKRARDETERERRRRLGVATGEFQPEPGLWDSGRSK